MARATGIEITETEVRVAEVEGSDKKYRVLAAARVDIPADEEGKRSQEAMAQATKAALKSARCKRDQLVLGLPAREAVIREIVVPFTDREQIRKVIKFESEAHLPSSNIDDVVVGFYQVSQTGPRSRLVIFAVEKNVLKSRLDALGSIGIEPNQVDLAPAALFALTPLLPELALHEDGGVQVVLDIGDLSTTAMVIQGDSLRMIRSMRLGTESLARTISADLGIGRDEARTMTQSIMRQELPFASADEVTSQEPSTELTPAELRQDIVRDKEADFARRIVNEIRRTLSSVHVDGNVETLWMTGPGSTSPGLERALQDSLGVPVKHLDVLSGGDSKADGEAVQWAGPAIGLGLKALEHDPVGLEFRQEEFAFSRKFDRIRSPLLFAATLVGLLLAFLIILEYKKVRDLQSNINWLSKRGQASFKDHIVNNSASLHKYLGYAKPDEPSKKLSSAQKKKEDLKQIQAVARAVREPLDSMRESYGIVVDDGGGEKPPEQITVSALKRLNDWIGSVHRIRNKGIRVKIDKLNISTNKITWEMRIPVASLGKALDMWTEEMEAMPDFRSYDGGSSSASGDTMVIKNAKIEFLREGA